MSITRSSDVNQTEYYYNLTHILMKSIEINMAALSQAQRKMCVELIAQSNIKF
jgi:hypothetical protein